MTLWESINPIANIAPIQINANGICQEIAITAKAVWIGVITAIWNYQDTSRGSKSWWTNEIQNK